jgi:prophage antirepressor-like protein
MEVIKAFTTNQLHTNITIKGTYEKPLFRAIDIGEVLGIANIRTSIAEFKNDERYDVSVMDVMGRSQNTTFLTEKGLYKVLFKSRKPIAEQFQNWVCEVIQEIRLQGTYTLQHQLKEANEQIEEAKTTIATFDSKLTQEKALEKHRVLLQKFANIGSIIYILKVKSFEDGAYIIKIGESRRGIEARHNEHKTKYEEALLLDCFCVLKSKDFEHYLHHHEKVRPHKVNNLNGHENEIELFRIGTGLTYTMLVQIIEQNIKSFNEYNNNDFMALQKENETLKALLQDKSNPDTTNNLLINQYEELKTSNKLLESQLSTIENKMKEILEHQKQPIQPIRTQTGFGTELTTLGPRLQQIAVDTLTLIKVYESVAECIKESNFKYKRPSIDKAIKDKIVYMGYIWNFVPRNEDATIVPNLNVTNPQKQQNIGYIAKLNQEKNRILNVYIDRKTAANENGYPSNASLDLPVKNGNLTNGHYYILYDHCEADIRDVFEQQIGKEPLLYKDGLGQFNEKKELVREFVCKYDAIKKLQMSDKTMAKCLDKDIAYNGFFYRRLGSKLSV